MSPPGPHGTPTRNLTLPDLIGAANTGLIRTN
ncbi:hypothetical protein FRAAL1048 [Frankia alni ACN14a]|uniref:Uncharacterized protein n=1 Tax=Frankia alni (strain DSM 45986 / CECT 9034 / ACN14a) TaxID=326424 RepID=Q0RRV2_FRAAA|nr:hypothetical protein FRAAL1048 [Frankia alni ACN14a]